MGHDSGNPRRRRTDIQGLRAVAVIAVVVEHVFAAPRGGFTGVDVFFVISGFLITGLMLREHGSTGRISLARFYGRRARRILPVLVLVLGVTLLAMSVLANHQRFVKAAVDAGWAAVFLANQHFAAVQTDYFAADGPVSPFQHLWSLSVEEQYYAVWPLVLVVLLATAGRGGRSTALIAGSALAVLGTASFVWGWHRSVDDPTRAYFATPLRVWELSAGALIAVVRPALARMRRLVGASLAWGGLALIVAGFLVADGGAGVPVPGVVPAVAGAVLVIVGGSAEGVGAPWVLRNAVAQAIGAVSYSLYLWHFPVLVLVQMIEPGAVWAVLPIAGALAFISHELVERPALRVPVTLPTEWRGRSQWQRWWGEDGRRVQMGAVGAVALTAVLVTTLSVDRLRPPPTRSPIAAPTAGTDGPSPSATGSDGGQPTETGQQSGRTALRAAVTDALQAVTWPELDPSPDGRIPGGAHLACGDSTKPPSVAACTFGDGAAARTMMLVGDSTAVHELDALIDVVEAADTPWRLVSRAAFACSFMDARIGNEVTEACAAYRQETLELIAREHPDVLVVTDTYEALPAADHPGDITVAEWSAAIDRYLERVRPLVGAVVHVSPPPAGKDIEDCYGPTTHPADCVSAVGTAWQAHASAIQAVARARSQPWIDVAAMVCVERRCPAFVGVVPVRKDFVHFSAAFQHALAPALGEALGEALDQALDDDGLLGSGAEQPVDGG